MSRPFGRPLPFALIALIAAGCPAYEMDEAGYGRGGGGDDDDGAWGDDDDDDDDGPDDEEPTEPPEDGLDDVCEGAADVPVTLYMSADDSNSQAAPVLARHMIDAGMRSPGQGAPYEFLNYYDFDLAPAEPGSVRLEAQMRPIVGTEGGYSVLVAAVAEERTIEERADLNLVMSIDRSCSMGGLPIDLAKQSMEQMTASLREGDIVSIVEWSAQAATIIDGHVVQGASDATLVQIIRGISEGGGTDLHNGLVHAYEVAASHASPERLSRVVLLSDGGANLGQTSAEIIGAAADDSEAAGTYLVGVGASTPGNYAHDLMNEVTDMGKGSYIYIDDQDEAEHQFRGRRFISNLDVAALDVRLAVEVPAGFVIDEFHGEEISKNPEDVEPQHLAPNDSMQYHFTLVDCPEAPAERDTRFTFTITWTDPVTREQRSEERDLLLEDLLGGDVRALVKADALVAYAEALPRGSRTSEDLERMDAALQVVQEAVLAFPQDADLAEVLDLLTRTRNL